jgi:hypothetical protein
MDLHLTSKAFLLVGTIIILAACGEVSNNSPANTLSARATGTVQFSCVFEDLEESTRFEFNFAEHADSGTFSYKYSPVGDPTVVEGSIQVKLAAASWNAYVYQGNDARAAAKLNTPRNPGNGAVRLEMSVVVSGKALEPRQFLECQEIR